MNTLVADIILIVHFGIALFLILGFVLTWIGFVLGWKWIRNVWFRLIHVGLMGFVALEALLGKLCPLTVWEAALRDQNTYPAQYQESFIKYWLHKLLYLDFPLQWFTIGYVLFFLCIIGTLIVIRPHFTKK